MTKNGKILEPNNDFENLHDTKKVLVVDFMPLISRLPMRDFPNFELLVAERNYIEGACKFSELYIVFGSYIADSSRIHITFSIVPARMKVSKFHFYPWYL